MRLLLPLLLLSLAAGAAERPNVLFIAVDDLRPELGAYGNRVVQSPNIDRLAARGVVFDHAYCQQAVCSPSRSSLLTGRRPDATKVWDLETHFRAALPEAVTLPQHFRENGYYCAALSKIYHHGFEDGRSWSEPHWYPDGSTIAVDPADWTKRQTVRIPRATAPPARAGGSGKKGAKGAAFERSERADDELADGATAAEAVRRLAALKAKGQPFFLAVGFLKPHLPFIAPKKYWDLYDPAKIPSPAFGQMPEGAPAFAGHTNGELHSYAGVPAGNPIPEDFARELRHGYYACVSFLDAQVGRLLEALEKEGLAQNTVVILWGDHGWQLGEHGLWHKHTNFEIAARAPLILSVPGQKTAGQHCAAPVEFVDIYPTLAEVCGLPQPQGLDGVSLAPLLANPAGTVKRAALSQYPRGGAQTDGQPLMGYSARDSRWRLTLWKHRATGATVATELYDEQNDPNETKNLATAPEGAAAVAELTPIIEKYASPTAPAGDAAPKGNKPAKPKQDRDKMFLGRDADKDGKLTMDEFMQHQPDPEAAKQRFPKFDKNGDGVLSREEFVGAGR